MKPQLFIFIGGSDEQNGDYSLVHRLAEHGGTVNWSSLKGAQAGDRVLIYIRRPHSALVAKAEVLANPAKGEPGEWAYLAKIGRCQLLPNQVSIKHLKDEFPQWAWLRFPRGKAVVPKAYAKRLWSLVHEKSTSDGRSDVSSEISQRFTAKEYIAALLHIQSRITAEQRLMLMAHAAAPGRVMTVFQLAAAAGSKAANFTYSVYGRLGRMLGEALQKGAKCDTIPIWTRYIGDDYRLERGGPVVWKMRLQLAEALDHVNWEEPSDRPNPISDIEHARGELMKAPETQREAIVLSRIGQGPFRKDLLHYWKSCAVTGVSVAEALRASHIKPWSNSSNQERLNPFNGFLLVGTLDLLFDAGLISFDKAGHILISLSLSSKDRRTLGLSNNMKLRWLEQRHQPYLAFHRTHVFQIGKRR